MYERLKLMDMELTEFTVNQTWLNLCQANETFVTWDMILNSTYSYLNDSSIDKDTKANGEKYMIRDKIRFSGADLNGDEKLSRQEFLYFVSPSASNATKHILVDEIFADMDKNKDGFVDFDEYISEFYGQRNENIDENWIKSEKSQFFDHRDQNKDGKLDKKEVKEMFFPDNYDPIEAESHHLIAEADDNKDGKLSIEEMLAHPQLFIDGLIRSLSTTPPHDEL
ncbi:hypothetical protein ACOME3_008034 [Neoechinorhynchus agilis]